MGGQREGAMVYSKGPPDSGFDPGSAVERTVASAYGVSAQPTELYGSPLTFLNFPIYRS